MQIRIFACKEREDNVKKMLSSLPKETEVIWDEDHNALHTLQRALRHHDSLLIMEDDIELCKNFFQKAKAEIDQRPESFIMFYSCKEGEVIEAENKKNGIPYNRPFVYTQAFYVPPYIGPKLARFLETNHSANHHRYSIGINQFLRQENIDRYLVQPSLVQHIWFESILDAGKWFPMHQSKTYRYDLDSTEEETTWS